MRLSASIIPRFYAPLKTLTRQSPRLSPALTAVNATTTTTTITTFTLNNRMSTSSASQSPFPSSSSTRQTAADGAAKTEPTRAAANDDHHQQRQIPSEESHRQHHPTESTSPAPENATSNAPAGDDNAFSPSDSTHSQPLALPPLPEAPSSSAGGDSAEGGGNSNSNNTITLDLGGQPGGGASTKLDHLGPLVVNQDGTMSRISNWGEMTKIERENTLRILGRRNQIRLASLRDGADGEGKQQ
ncbi:von willebrand factor [Colletotrichum karsti]|uniref:von willebrand factor n=1 Tax=Colletotrichum karsti TaxID=1095194 RepID=A0A9P6I228_9PEZI|nr:von willebrand factor [Colletotrichum karsti]KAF9870490.1 von willebrand factor [Colletotrichum karsti]